MHTPPRILCIAAALACLLAACASTDSSFKLPKDSSADLKKAVEAASRGDKLRKEKKWDKAAAAYQESIAAKGDIGAVWVNAGVCLMQMGDFLPARDAFLRAADLIPGDSRPYENLGTLYHLRGYDKEALDYYCKAADLDPNSLTAHRGLATAIKNTRAVSPAMLERMDRAILLETNPEYLRMMRIDRGRIAESLKETEKATS